MKWLLALVITILPLMAYAQPVPCLDYNVIKTRLEAYWDESPIHRGYTETIAGEVYIIEIWGSPDSETFSMLRISSSGIACIFATGKELRPVKEDTDDKI
jgi:hypothetical protein